MEASLQSLIISQYPRLWAESSTREPNKKISAFGVDSRIRLLIVEEMAGSNLIVFILFLK
jgi:hypothetical protein